MENLDRQQCLTLLGNGSQVLGGFGDQLAFCVCGKKNGNGKVSLSIHNSSISSKIGECYVAKIEDGDMWVCCFEVD